MLNPEFVQTGKALEYETWNLQALVLKNAGKVVENGMQKFKNFHCEKRVWLQAASKSIVCKSVWWVGQCVMSFSTFTGTVNSEATGNIVLADITYNVAILFMQTWHLASPWKLIILVL